ncbi:ABC transporter permease [Mesorhizobium sp. 43Arga]
MKARRKEEGRWAWRLTGFVTVCVYIFMFAPIVATVILSFNASMFGGFPMTGFSLQWYGKLMANDQVLTAFRTSLWIALVTAAVTTAIGVVTSYALVRFEFRGKQALSTLVILPALVPETILGVGLLVLIKAVDQPRTMLLLVLGHILLAVPYVVLITQARMVGIRRVYEEAALSLGASRFSSFREITLPLLIPAVVGGALLAFTISFDNTSASLFWRPAGVETMPTQILSMLKISISPEINALGTVMILVTVGIPLLGGLILQSLTRLKRRGEPKEKHDEIVQRQAA